MSIQFLTDNPRTLLAKFKKKIDDGNIDTWEYDKEGDFTHTPNQWIHRAWLRPALESDRLTLHILNSKKYAFTWATYGVYHGRFVESMLTHCHNLFTATRIAPKPGALDANPVD